MIKISTLKKNTLIRLFSTLSQFSAALQVLPDGSFHVTEEIVIECDSTDNSFKRIFEDYKIKNDGIANIRVFDKTNCVEYKLGDYTNPHSFSLREDKRKKTCEMDITYPKTNGLKTLQIQYILLKAMQSEYFIVPENLRPVNYREKEGFKECIIDWHVFKNLPKVKSTNLVIYFTNKAIFDINRLSITSNRSSLTNDCTINVSSEEEVKTLIIECPPNLGGRMDLRVKFPIDIEDVPLAPNWWITQKRNNLNFFDIGYGRTREIQFLNFLYILCMILLPYLAFLYFHQGSHEVSKKGYDEFNINDISVGAVNVLLENMTTERSIVSSVFQLIVNGYISLEPIEKGKFILRKIKDLNNDESKINEILFSKLFPKGLEAVHSRKLKLQLKHFQQQFNDELKNKNLIRYSFDSVRNLFTGFVIVGGVLALPLIADKARMRYWMPAVIFAMASATLKGKIDVKTIKGKIFASYLEDYKMEFKDKISKMTYEELEEAFPLAIALKMEDDWMEKVKNYQSPNMEGKLPNTEDLKLILNEFMFRVSSKNGL